MTCITQPIFARGGQAAKEREEKMAVDGIIGIKLGMTQVFAEDGNLVGCTVLQAGPCVVVQRRTMEKDGYEAAQLGLVEFVKPQRVNKAMTGHFKKANVAPMKVLQEIRLAESKDETKVGDRVLVENFKAGELVDVSGVSKGKGFAGGVKRWHYAGGDSTHGSMFHRATGTNYRRCRPAHGETSNHACCPPPHSASALRRPENPSPCSRRSRPPPHRPCSFPPARGRPPWFRPSIRAGALHADLSWARRWPS